MKSANAYPVLENGENYRNDNAEWAILKEEASYGRDRLSSSIESQSEKDERDKYRRRGKMLLEIVNRMPDHLSAAVKAETLDKIHKSADVAGITDDLEDVLGRRIHPFLDIEKQILKAGASELSVEEEARVEELREKVFDMANAEQGALSAYFPSGNFLYHGSTTKKIGQIFQTGGIKNGIALIEDNPDATTFDTNSGFEGVSWSMNAIDALPGDRGHLAGFLAAPEDVLSDDEQLVIPSRPAPYEVLQVADEVNPKALYDLKKQAETWGGGIVSLGEKNNVYSNLMTMKLVADGNKYFKSSMVYEYDGDLSAEALRKYFTINDNNEIIFDEDLNQKNEVPPALPWFQSLIDRGRLQRGGYEELDNVEKVIERTRTDSDFRLRLLGTAKKESQPVVSAYNTALDDAKAVRIKPEEMYFVTSHRDLEDWLKVIARTGANPKGILLYDDDKVVMENFASKYDGNQEELSHEIGHVVGVNKEFWRSEMGFEPQELPRSGSRGQVLLESAINRDKSIKMKDGELVVEEVADTVELEEWNPESGAA